MRFHTVAALLGLAMPFVSAQVTQKCPSSNVCYSLNIPDATASSGKGDIYIQLSAPTTYSWVALGQGSAMSGSNMFVIYTSGDGKNVTLSPRLGTGNVMPKYSSATQVSLLEGSGVQNGMMVANIKCSNCDSWSGGKMDFTGSSGSWIWAAKSGSALNSNDQSASISQHSSMGGFKFDFAQAKGGSSVNPFANAVASSSGSAGTAAATTAATRCQRARTTGVAAVTAAPDGPRFSGGAVPSEYASYWTGSHPTARPTGNPFSKRDDDDDDACDDDSSSSNNGATSGAAGAFEQSGYDPQRTQRMLVAHGVMASLAFVILFPAGAISIRVLSFPGLIWFHAGLQVLSYLIFIAAFGIGVYMATNWRMLNKAHPIIGILLFVLLFFQPFLGILHHLAFKRHHRRTFWSYGHLWLGRIVITLGIINGGLGLQLANNTSSGKVAYAVIAAIVWLAYVAAAVYGERKRRVSAGPKTAERVSGASETSFEMQNREFYGKPPAYTDARS